MRVLLAGGGSAGHIEPALALADAVRRIDPGAEVTCLGTERGLETRLIPLRGYPLELIPAVPMPRSVTPKLLTVPGRLASAVNAAAAAIDRTRAQVLVGFGGYVATPAYLAARRRKIPIVVHEANPKPGLANRLGARFTTHVFTGHPDTQLRNGKYLGIPIRREIADLDRLGLGDKARTHFGLRPDLPVLLVTGGSQGARSLNEAVFGAAGWLREAGVQVLHIIGPRNGHEAPVVVRRALRGRALYRPDGSRLRGGGLRAVPGGRDDLRRAHRRGAAGRLRPAAHRQRRAAAERAADRAAGRRHAGDRR
jgi:UDP-N-acetylglucosamine--N-acetylmuramyl-(pentapeptide) pyrophosphoryl-undecaprenol N-acetylglucosamine transferase